MYAQGHTHTNTEEEEEEEKEEEEEEEGFKVSLGYIVRPCLKTAI